VTIDPKFNLVSVIQPKSQKGTRMELGSLRLVTSIERATANAK